MEASILPPVDGRSLVKHPLSLENTRRSRVLTCKRCKFSTVDSKQFLSHQFKAHNSTDEESIRRCDKCSFVTTKYTELLAHKRNKHRRSLVLSSRKNSMEGDSGFLEETNNNNNNTNPIKVSSIHQDVISTGDFASRSTPTTHESGPGGAEGIMVYECRFCPYATAKASDYSKHLETHRGGARGGNYGNGAETGDDGFDGYEGGDDSLNVMDRDRDYEIKQMQKSYGSEQLKQGSGSYRIHDPDDDEQVLVIDENPTKSYAPAPSVVQRSAPTQVPVMGMPVRAKPGPKPNSGISKPRTGCAPVREAVDPAKYITIQEPDGIKYACSKCGNIYKWRKSLNKHWKEKHDGEIPDARPNLTALNIPRLGKGYVTGLPNGKGNVISFMQPQQHTESPPKPNQQGYMGEMSSAIRTALKRPAMAEAAVQDTMRKNSMVKTSPSPQRNQQPKMPRMSQPEAYHRFGSSPSGKDKVMQSMAKYSPSSMGKARGPYRESAVDMARLPTQQMPRPGSSHLPNQLTQPDILDLSKKAPEITIRQISPVKATAVDAIPQDEPMDLSVKPSKCDVIVSSIKHDTERVEGFGYAMDDMSSLGRQCPSCSYIASSKHDYDQHMELHFSKRHRKCAECQAVLGSMERLNEHFISVHMDTIQQNMVANFGEGPSQRSKATANAESTQLYKYLTMDSQHQQLSCMVCGVICQWPWTLAKHFQQEHPMLPNPYQKKGNAMSATTGSQPPSPPLSDEEYPVHDGQLGDNMESLQCTQCSYMADTPTELSKHQMQHGSSHQFVCRICSYVAKWKDQMVRHYKQEHPTAAINLNQIAMQHPMLSDSEQYMSPSGRQLVDLSDEDTAIVFPQAPEDEVPPSGRRPECKPGKHNMQRVTSPGASTEMNLPFKCTVCEYRARWPSEITQHTKNHSDEKPFLCPRCSYRSKWKWDVVKHLKRCGGGTVNDVIDTTKQRKAHNVQAIMSDTKGGMSLASQRELLSNGPPNVTVMPQDGSMDLTADRDLSDALNMSHASDDGLPNGDEKNVFGSHIDGSSGNDPNSQAYHVCLHCPFVGNSPAELKRHSRVHSDEKPFICKTCGYCSKWKCDLKKHLRTYNHTSAVPLTYGGHGRKPADWKEKSEDGTSDGDSNDEKMAFEAFGASPSKAESPFLYKCDKVGCQYVTYKKNFMDSHMKIHRTTVTQKPALKCKQCEFEAADLPTFLQHKLTHSTQQPGESLTKLVSPEGNLSHRENSPTDLVTKHRRKASHQNRIISSRSSNDEDDGEAEALDGRRSLPVGTVGPLVHDLSSTRPAFTKATAYNCMHCPYRTENRINFEKHTKFHNIQNKYVCEWCSWSIDRLNLLYRHAQTVHPAELALQEKETFYGKVRGRRSSEPQSQDSAEDLDYKDDLPLSPGESAADMTRKMSWAKRQDMSNIEKRRVEARREISGFDEEIPPEFRSKRRRRLKTCQKCGYITDNVTTLQRHMAKHGSHGKFTCDYCDYSVDRQHIVEYHIKIVHETGRPTKSQNEEPTELEDQLAEMEDASMVEDDHSDQDAMTDTNEEANGEGTINGSDNSIAEIIRVKGKELKVQREGNKATYHCLKCPFLTGNITNACNHVKQHGARKKYTCEVCDYSLDQLRHVMQHMRKVHGLGGEYPLSDNGEDGTLGEHVDDTVTDATYDENTLDYATASEQETKPDLGIINNSARSMKRKTTLYNLKGRVDYRRYHCVKCPFVGQDLAALKRHQISHRRIGARFPCAECSYKATTAKLLNVHAKSHLLEQK